MDVIRAQSIVRKHLFDGDIEIPVIILKAIPAVLEENDFRRELVDMASVFQLAHVKGAILEPSGLI
ncbi:hypothetical protein H9P43_000247 [Blastocladiella emersonii ATCC 22665]|nr:hypothetical protein H9P43_000247 [Blastocladiella emersonii ATCC 22665]